MNTISKKKREITITPVGYSAQSVTGSCNLVNYFDTTFAVELGGIQEGHTILNNYNMNKELLSKIKPQELKYIFVLHCHYDHIGLIPAMYATNKCDAKIIAPSGSTAILKEMWLDSAKIMDRDCIYLNKKFNRSYESFYSESDVETALSNIIEFDSNKTFNIADELSFRYISSGHIMLAKQLELFIKINSHVSKILFTSDLGNLATENKRIFVDDFEPVIKSNIVIGESTYGLRSQRNSKKDFQKDLEKIKSVVMQFCVDDNNRVLIPSFSLDKTPIALWYLYELFGADKSFKVPIIVDSPLAIRLIYCYSSILSDDEKIKMDKLMNWKNLRLITDHMESRACIEDGQSKVVISSGGMLQSGRSVHWAQSIVPQSGDCILFMGYCGEDTLGWKLKHSKEQKTVTINNKALKNRCQIVELKSFSSHMQHDDLVNYYKNIQADSIYLLHGDEKARLELKEDLEIALSKMCKSTKVKIVNKSTVIRS